MISISLGQAMLLLGAVVMIGNAFFFIGVLWQRVNGHSRDIDRHDGNFKVLFGKIEDIWEYVRNGKRPAREVEP